MVAKVHVGTNFVLTYQVANPTSRILTTKARRLQKKNTATTQKSIVARPCSLACDLPREGLLRSISTSIL